MRKPKPPHPAGPAGGELRLIYRVKGPDGELRTEHRSFTSYDEYVAFRIALHDGKSFSCPANVIDLAAWRRARSNC